ncbi:MAG: 1,4-alpha-glucan branching enzyme [Fibrobacteres bacterium]|nr:1,4-alpha-glucan branching enzyme [Fibrobacterota bacterium]
MQKEHPIPGYEARGAFRALAILVASALAGMGNGAASAPPAWSLNQPIYEVNLQLFTAAGTYKALQQRLPQLKAQGVGILWLMPIMTRGQVRAFGSPYCVKDYKGFHAPFGSERDFRDLVAAVHAADMHIILDWVPNHTSWDNALTVEHKDFYKRDGTGNIQQAYGWSDVAQLDYSNPDLRTWMIDALKYWVAGFDVDGFRFDVAWGVPNDFWDRARAELEAVKPMFLLAEDNNPDNQTGFHSNYDWDMMPVTETTPLIEIAKGAKPLSLLDDLLAKEARAYKSPFMRMRFTSNHDEFANFGTPAQRLGGAVRPLAVLTATLPGKPLIYNGQEIGWNPGNRGTPITWNDTSSFLDFYGRLFRLFQADPALHAGSYLKLKSSQDAAVFAYARSKDKDRVVVLLNLTAQARDFTLTGLDLTGAYKDLFSDQAVDLNASPSFNLGPWGYRVLVMGAAHVGLTSGPPERSLRSASRSSIARNGSGSALRARFRRAGQSDAGAKDAFDALGASRPPDAPSAPGVSGPGKSVSRP